MSENTTELDKKNRFAWKALLAGVLLGVLVSLLVLVILAFKYGPRSENITVDLYSGHVITHRSFLWKRSHIHQPKPVYVQWAIEHQDPVRSWYLPCAGTGQGWFEPGISVDFTTRVYVYQIHSLKIPEEEKVKLLHQYHEELDALRLKDQELGQSRRFMERFYEDWEQKLKDLETQEAQ